MHYQKNELYHIYNRGNQKQKVFYSPKHYGYFIGKMKKHLVPCCDLLAWSLMPNHFHFLIHANQISVTTAERSGFPMQNLSEGIRKLLSSYTKGFNRDMVLTGNLFQQHTRAKLLVCDEDINLGHIAFNYIHQNPLKARLVFKAEHWLYSSFRDYIGKRKNSLCRKDIAMNLLALGNPKQIYKETHAIIDSNQSSEIFHQSPAPNLKKVLEHADQIVSEMRSF